jgi:hypothetical protein
MTAEPALMRRLLIAGIAAAVILFVAALYLMGRDSRVSGSDAVGPSTFSRSAIGHAGLAELIRRSGMTVVKSQAASTEKLGDGGLLVVAEPVPQIQSDSTLRALLDAPAVLLVLPKWRGEPSRSRPDWVGEVELKPVRDAQWALGLAIEGGEVVRDTTASGFTTNRLGPQPQLVSPRQLVRAQRLRPLVASDQGILVGEMTARNRRLVVLADPDAIANHALGEKDNAAFALALIDLLRSGDGPVVFDETVHGYIARTASPLRLLFEYPFVLVTVQAAVALLLLLWATAARFGAPQPVPPPLAAGKGGLIRNAADLIAFAGHRRTMVRRYVQATLRDVARRFHAPPGLTDAGLIAWLERIAKARAVSVDCRAVLARVEAQSGEHGHPSGLVAIAHDINRWKREIVDADR